jgi:uncharacterized protein YlbG (UPF0298 family)
MAEVMVQVKDKSEVLRLSTYGTITHTSKYINAIIMEVPPNTLEKLRKDPNVIEIREGEVGEYQV